MAEGIEEVKIILDRIDDCLFLNGCGSHRKFVLELKLALERGLPEFGRAYCSANWWGGAGSMSDLWPGDSSETSKYRRLLIELVEKVEALEGHCDIASMRASQLKS
jgi:hypothetical protein